MGCTSVSNNNFENKQTNKNENKRKKYEVQESTGKIDCHSTCSIDSS